VGVNDRTILKKIIAVSSRSHEV